MLEYHLFCELDSAALYKNNTQEVEFLIQHFVVKAD